MLLFTGILITIYGILGSKPAVTILANKKAKTAKNLLNRKSLLLVPLLLA